MGEIPIGESSTPGRAAEAFAWIHEGSRPSRAVLVVWLGTVCDTDAVRHR